MAKVETRRQLLLTSEEKETLRKAKGIFLEINAEDIGNEIFYWADNGNTEWDWLAQFIENLISDSEEE